MRYYREMKVARGVSLIDVIVGSALVLVIFLSLIGLLRASLLVSSLAKAKAGATAVANNQMELVRSLSYDAVGTVGGIPSGSIPQYATSTQNAIPYRVRTFIEYVDDPADGVGAADANAITTDYKRIKIAVTYTVRGTLREVDLVSNYAPLSIETSTNGGTLKVLVVDATGVGVAGAAVRVVNASSLPSVDVTTFSDSTGTVLLGGAATSTQYQVYISKTGYSSAQTYVRDTTNQNPTPGYLTVVKNQTTASTFAIDRLASLTLRTYFPISATTTTDTFADASKLAAQSNTSVVGGFLTLATGGSGYVLSGTARSAPFAPSYLVSWTTASTTLALPAGTSALVSVVDGSGTFLPDSVIPGNSTGFSDTSIDLSTVSTTTYPSLALSATLSTNATTTTPHVDAWSINALVGPVPVPNVAVTLTGAKTVGSTGAGTPIAKTTLASTTGALGVLPLSIEWDSYSLGLTGYDVLDACTAPPYSLSPGSSNSASLYLGPNSTNAVLVSVHDNASALVSGATVTLSKTGFTDSSSTSSCGTAYFGSLTSGTYSITITKSGYTSTTYANVTVSGHIFYATSFP
ncbi:MAG: Autotransporter adhesin [Parcubacteria group bacterium]|nr:Autotransporter adhesin [Parcubacteria group bacterium]